jgi:hypothetical protein
MNHIMAKATALEAYRVYGCSSSISIISPGVQSRASHRAIRVENLMAFALPHLRMERFESGILIPMVTVGDD